MGAPLAFSLTVCNLQLLDVAWGGNILSELCLRFQKCYKIKVASKYSQ